MTRLLMFVAPFLAIAACWLLASRVSVPRARRRQRVSSVWLSEFARIESRTEPKLEHVLYVDNVEVCRVTDEGALLGLKADLKRELN